MATETSPSADAEALRELEVFAYAVAHDLRAPLRTIDGFGQALIEDFGDELGVQARGYIARMRGAAKDMSRLIDSLMELASLSRGEVRRVEVDLSAIARALAERLSSLSPQRRIEWVIAPGVSAVGDPDLLEEVLRRLLDNAWKFTGRHASARIEFGVERRRGVSRYFVRDDGAGFDPVYAGRLFTPLQRLHGAAEFPGAGVGLAIARRIVRLHGGAIEGEGRVENGAKFSFTLPRSGR